MKAIKYLLAAVAGILSVIACTTSFADTHYWIGGGGNNDWGTGANWDTGTAPAANDALCFSGSTRLTPNNNLTANIAFGYIYFDSGGFTVSGNSIANNGSYIFNNTGNNTFNPSMVLSFTPIFRVGDGTTLTLGGTMSGTGGINIGTADGYSGTLSLTGQNTYSGSTTITRGTLLLGSGATLANTSGVYLNSSLGPVLKQLSSNSINDSATITMTGGTTWDMTGVTEAVGAISSGNASDRILLGSGSLTVNQTSSQNFYGTISGTGGSFTKNGAGKLYLYGQNTYTGGTTINAGSMVAYVDAALSNTGAVAVNSGGVYDLYNSTDTIGDLVINGTGKLVSTGSLAYLYTDSLSGTGSIQAPSAHILLYTGYDNTDQTYSGQMSGNISLNKYGTGTLTLAGLNSGWTGGNGTYMYAGKIIAGTSSLGSQNVVLYNAGTTLEFSGNNVIGDSLPVNLGAGTFMDMKGYSDTIYSLYGSGNITTSVGSTLTINTAGGSYYGSMSGGGSLTVANGALHLYGTNTFTGALNVNGTQLYYEPAAQIVATDIDLTNSGSVYFNRTGNDVYTNAINGTGSVYKTGTGTLTFTGTSGYSGATSVSAGKLLVNGRLTNSSQTSVSSGATLGGSGNIGAVSLSGTISPGNSPGIFNTGAETWDAGARYLWEVNDAAGSKGATTGTGWDWLNINGSLTLPTSGLNYIDITSLTSGNVSGNCENFDPGSNYSWTIATASGGISNFSAGRFSLNYTNFKNPLAGGTFGIAKSGNDLVLQFTHGSRLWNGLGADSNLNTAGNWVENAAPVNGGAITFAGSTRTSPVNNISSYSPDSITFSAGGFTLTGNALTVTNGIANNAGENTVSTNLTLGGNQSFTAADGTTLNIGGTVAMGANTLTVSGLGTVSIGGVMSGNGSLAKTGVGMLKLLGSNTYTGTTTVSGGTLQYGTDNAVAAGAMYVNGAVLDMNGHSDTSGEVFVTGGGRIIGGGTLSAADFQIAEGTISATLGGTGTLTKTGTGVFTLSGSNTYSGLTTVSEGTLILDGSVANSDVIVNAGALLKGAGILDALSGAGTVAPGNSPGILTTTQVNPLGGLDWDFEYTGFDPVYNPITPADSVNDILRITHADTPFTADLGLANVINIYFDMNSINTGDIFHGGFYADNADFLTSIDGATFNYYLGSKMIGSGDYFTLATYQQDADFGGGIKHGYVMELTAMHDDSADVPEPSTLLLLLPFIGFGLRRLRRRNA